MNILSRYFKPWVVEDLGRDGLYYDVAYAVSMLLAGLLMPALGALSDGTGKKKMFLFLFTLTCCLALGLIPLLPASLFIFAIVLFAISNFFYEGGMVFYNALLYSVAEGKKARSVSGFGVALGYLGSIAGLVVMLPIVYGDLFGIEFPGLPGWGVKASFFPTAVVFMLFSIPTFLWVKEKRWAVAKRKKKISDAYREVFEGIRDTKKYPGVLRFLVADYFFEDAVATVILNIGLFCSVVLGLKGSNIDLFLIISTVSAVAGSFLIGHISQKMSLKRLMALIVWGWVALLAGFAFIDNIVVIYIMGSLVGVVLGGLWTVSRPLLAEMVPKAELGRFFGLYSLSGRTAAILGPIVWGSIIYFFNPARPLGKSVSGLFNLSGAAAEKLPYQLAVMVLAVIMIAGLFIFRKVPERGTEMAVTNETD